MNKRRMYSTGLTVLLLCVVITTYGVWAQGDFSHGVPGNDQGCYCHNNNIAVFVNDTGDGLGGVPIGPVKPGVAFHLLISTSDAHATGVVPELQLWESNQTDNALFSISPVQVISNSSLNLNKTAGDITVLYKMTAPMTEGYYKLTMYAQGTLLQPVLLEVSSAITTTTSSTTTSTTTSSSSTTSSTTSTTTSTSSTTTSSITTTASTTSTTTSSTTSNVSTSSSSSFPISYLAIVGVGVAVLAILGLSGRAMRSRIRPATRL